VKLSALPLDLTGLSLGVVRQDNPRKLEILGLIQGDYDFRFRGLSLLHIISP